MTPAELVWVACVNHGASVVIHHPDELRAHLTTTMGRELTDNESDTALVALASWVIHNAQTIIRRGHGGHLNTPAKALAMSEFHI